MLRYSELSTSQKELIGEMRKGYELRYIHATYHYCLYDSNGFFIDRIARRTAESLINRHYIYSCFTDGNKTVFCVNIEIEGFGTEF